MPTRVRKPTPQPPPPAPTEPLPAAKGARLADLKGTVRTLRPNSGTPYGIPWSNVTRYAKHYAEAEDFYTLPRFLNAAMGVVESDSTQERDGVTITRDDGFGDGLSVGIMQVKPQLWQSVAPEADPYQARGNIFLGSALMAQFIKKRGSWQQAIVKDYFPTNDANGTTQSAYVQAVTSLMSEMANQLQATPSPAPPPSPQPAPAADPYTVIGGGVPYSVNYGFRADVGLNYYLYGVGHGTTTPTQHTGDDVLWPDETKLYTPIDGVVTCVGWTGEVTWGQGCGYYEDYTANLGHDRSIGNITIKGTGKAEGYKLVLGHCSDAAVIYGQGVKAGQLVGYSGGMNGPHTHVEVAVQKNGAYWLVDPKPALVLAMGGQAPIIYADRQPFILSDDNPERWVEAIEDGVPVLQFANPQSAPVRAPLKKGERFKVGTQVLGTDGTSWYWLTSIGSRIPVKGTKEV